MKKKSKKRVVTKNELFSKTKRVKIQAEFDFWTENHMVFKLKIVFYATVVKLKP